MRKLALIFAVCLSAAELSVAQDSPPPTVDAPAQAHETYVVQITEYRLNVPTDPSQTVPEIIELLTNRDADQRSGVIETIRLSSLSGAKSHAQFGRQIKVTTGTMSVRGATTRQMQSVQLGTIVQVTAEPRSGKVAVDINYESSRLDGDGTEDSPPDIATTEIQTTQLLEFGKPTLIGGSSSGASSYVLLTVTR